MESQVQQLMLSALQKVENKQVHSTMEMALLALAEKGKLKAV